MPSIVSSHKSIVLGEAIQVRNSYVLLHCCTAAKVHNLMRAIRTAQKSISCKQPRSQSPSDDGPQPRLSDHNNRSLSRNLNKPLSTNNIRIKTHHSTKTIKHQSHHTQMKVRNTYPQRSHRTYMPSHVSYPSQPEAHPAPRSRSHQQPYSHLPTHQHDQVTTTHISINDAPRAVRQCESPFLEAVRINSQRRLGGWKIGRGC